MLRFQRWGREGPMERYWPAMLAFLIVVGLGLTGLWQGPEQQAYSNLLRQRGPIPWDDRVVIVAIDQPSLDALGYFPWRRSRYAQLLDQLSQAQPSVVAFNLVFSEPTPGDGRFARAIAHHRKVILAEAWALSGQPWQPTPLLRDAALSLGHISDPPDSDGKLRRITPIIGDSPALSYAALQAYRLFGSGSFFEHRLEKTLWVNWSGPMERIPQFSFADVLNGRIDIKTFQNKIVLVGVTAIGMNPINTPFDQNRASGIHLHATLVNQMLQNRSLHRPGPQSTGLILIGLAILGSLRPWWRFGTVGGVMIVGVVGSLFWGVIVLLAIRFDWWLPLYSPMALLGLMALFGGLAYTQRLEATNRRLGHLAHYDDLTQVPNRRYFDQHLRQEWSRLAREVSPLAIVICDVDFFKRYNDHQGHLAGDACLRKVAHAIQGSLKRPADIVARYGGEEFAVILPNTDLAGALQLSREILQAVRDLQIPHGDSPIANYVTLSLGAASMLPDFKVSPATLIGESDRALYNAKDRGRDQVCWHHPLKPKVADASQGSH
jgi:diguanylate cyclase (GGDEF)-like protein